MCVCVCEAGNYAHLVHFLLNKVGRRRRCLSLALYGDPNSTSSQKLSSENNLSALRLSPSASAPTQSSVHSFVSFTLGQRPHSRPASEARPVARTHLRQICASSSKKERESLLKFQRPSGGACFTLLASRKVFQGQLNRFLLSNLILLPNCNTEK